MRHNRLVTNAIAMIAAVACTGGADRAPADSTPAATARPQPAEPPASAVAELRVTPRGIGPIQAGTPLGDAAAATGGALIASAAADSSACTYAEWRGGPAGVRVMIEDARIARVDVDSGSTATDTGARIGDSEERIRSLYPGRVAVTPHKYTTGHYLTVTPPAAADSGFRLVFETEGERVVRYRAGRRPPVEYVERCG